jgi:hypothetical protein
MDNLLIATILGLLILVASMVNRVSTGLTFGTISSLYGLNAGIIDRAQFSVLVTTVILSAIVPTVIPSASFLHRCTCSPPKKWAWSRTRSSYRREGGESEGGVVRLTGCAQRMSARNVAGTCTATSSSGSTTVSVSELSWYANDTNVSANEKITTT